MAYQAIYRRWRPQVFDDVIGQNHITKTLKNEIINGKTAHAYLFCGTRGTGKTSTAKILAKAVNCLNPVDGNPCCECEVCRGISDESILDVIEIDAASKTSVDDIRQVIEEAMFSPTAAKKKVYIIDEVHMISESAFNALLKTLEEPPEHVMFILATTELHKIPQTILSRCQRFDFRRITNDDISGRIKTIAEGDGYTISPEALGTIAELGDGSMRDALSVLDQCLSYKDQDLTYDDVLTIVGIADDEILYEICDALADKDSPKALLAIDKVVNSGKDLGVFAERLVKILRDIMVVKLTKNAEGMFTYSEEKMSVLSAFAEKFSVEKLTNALKILNESYAKAKNSSFARTIYELAVVKMSSPEVDDSQEALMARIVDLEDKIKNGKIVSSGEAEPKEEKTDDLPWGDEESSIEEVKSPEPEMPMPSVPTAKAQEPKQAEKPQSTQEFHAGIDWQKIISAVRTLGGAPIFPHLLKVTPKIHNGKFVLVFEDNQQMSKEIISKPRNLEIVENAVKEVMGTKYIAECRFKKEMGIAKEIDDPLKKLEEIGAGHSVFEVVD